MSTRLAARVYPTVSPSGCVSHTRAVLYRGQNTPRDGPSSPLRLRPSIAVRAAPTLWPMTPWTGASWLQLYRKDSSIFLYGGKRYQILSRDKKELGSRFI